MSGCVNFQRTAKYEDVINLLKEGRNVYLYGGAKSGKSTLGNELQYHFKVRYCYIQVPTDIQCDTLSKISETIAKKLQIEIDKNCCGRVSHEELLSLIEQSNCRILFVFDDIDRFNRAYPDFKDDFNEWLHDLCLIDICQVVCISQVEIENALSLFFKNKSWRNIFQIVEMRVDENKVDTSNSDLKKLMEQWLDGELERGEYSESLLRFVMMGILGEIPLADAVRAANSIC